MVYASKYLSESGYLVKCLNFITEHDLNKYFESINEQDVIVLPMPLSRDNVYINGTVSAMGELKISDLFSHIDEKTVLVSSINPKEDVFECNKFYNYSESEAYVLENAYITAEGAVAHLLQHSPKTLKSSSVLILGWGRIAKYLHRIINVFTNNVSVVLRNRDTLSALKENGIDAYSFTELSSKIQGYDIIINTVPSSVLSEDILRCTKQTAYISELASSPGGYDHELAQRLGRSSYILRGLPGSCAPQSAGEALGKCIISYIENGGNEI